MRIKDGWAKAAVTLVFVLTVTVFAFIVIGSADGCGSVAVMQRYAPPDTDFAAVAARFDGRPPLMQSLNSASRTFDAATVTVSTSKKLALLRSLNVLGWDPKTNRVYRIRLPGYVVMWKGGDCVVIGVRLKLSRRDFARIPDGVLFDYQGRGGQRVMAWVE